MALHTSSYLKQYLCSASRSTPTQGPDDTVECIIGPKVLTSFTNNSNATHKCLHTFNTNRTWINQNFLPIMIVANGPKKTIIITQKRCSKYLSILLSRRSVTTGRIEVHKSSVIISLLSIRTIAISAQTWNFQKSHNHKHADYCKQRKSCEVLTAWSPILSIAESTPLTSFLSHIWWIICMSTKRGYPLRNCSLKTDLLSKLLYSTEQNSDLQITKSIITGVKQFKSLSSIRIISLETTT